MRVQGSREGGKGGGHKEKVEEREGKEKSVKTKRRGTGNEGGVEGRRFRIKSHQKIVDLHVTPITRGSIINTTQRIHILIHRSGATFNIY